MSAAPGVPWYPLELTTPVRQHVFGGRAIADRLGRTGLPAGRVAETWEVSDVDGDIARVTDGLLAGRTLRELFLGHPDELAGPGRRGPHFPLLTKFIDAHGALPVHLHADDRTARRLENQPHGKTEAWHILHAAPGATAYAGVREGVGRDALRRALLRQDFDAVLRRIPVRAGETVYVPGGTVHSFGPDTLVYEIEQTSDVQQHAMRHRMEDGSPLSDDEWHANVGRLLEQWDPAPRPRCLPGLALPAPGGTRTLLTAGPYFALERWTVPAGETLRHSFTGALVVTVLDGPAELSYAGGTLTVGRARTVLLPAALGEVELTGPCSALAGRVPDDLDRDVRAPLRAAGHAPEAVAALVASNPDPAAD
ncbi:class I mannose-6-phosphate isomerase [Streptomyces sp. NPDC021100]|uniref:class I mannose-6-phosphate isomerase n=1 Tax=Streptomyces sp. NPDC021100 TaxID=3365114 RepID=UPI0037B2BA75